MKKILNIALAAGAILFTASCAEDKGTSFEVSSANKNERVDRQHIRDYYGMDSLARMVTQAGPEVPLNGQLATEIVKAYYVNDRNFNEVKRMYNFTETARMGGQTTQADTVGTDPTSASDPMEQQSMQTVQDSVNVVTGGANKEDARSTKDARTGTRTTGSGSTKEQQSAAGDKATGKKATDKKATQKTTQKPARQ